MKKAVVTGRVIPERALVQFQMSSFKFNTPDGSGVGKVCCQMSLFSCILDFDQDVENIFTITSIAKEVVSNLSNMISFHIAGSYYIALDLVIDVETGHNHPVSTREPIFPYERPDFSFVPSPDHEPINIQHRHMESRQLHEALHELALALQRPHVTQMHCRRAIEAIRSHFEPHELPDTKNRESKGWESLRNTLRVDRADIESFSKLALDQRHGRVTNNSWPERKNALAITFEVIHRFMAYLLT